MRTGVPALSIRDLTRTFGGLRAVDSMNFDVFTGEIVGLLGPNGSGKTTVMNLISGALKPDSGEIALDGVPITKLGPNQIARKGVARTFQLVRVLETMTCLENVAAGMAFAAEPVSGIRAVYRSQTLLERVGLSDQAELLAGKLTYIDQKRLELARALALRPRVLLLDEWLAGLNPSEVQESLSLLRSLRDEGVTMVMVEHVMDAIRSLCDRCVVMSAGQKIADAPPAKALAEPEVVRAYLGDDDA